jgi:murein DD-endopeptidase MepM/ murein hydrolase activator NlpD
VRRRSFIALVAIVLGSGAVFAWPSVSELLRSPVPVGAALPVTAVATASAAPTVLPVLSPRPTAAPTPTSGPRPTASIEPAVQRASAVARGLAGDGLGAPDPRRLGGYRWPLANGVITGRFGPSPYGALVVHGERFHDGIDVASFCGDRVVAAHDGRVLAAGRRFDAWIGWIGSLGPHERRMDRLHKWSELPIVVIIDDGDGYRAIYAHFNAVTVRAGQYVRAGQQIGWEGSTGFATGCHVHFGLFSPLEGDRLELRPDVHRRTKYPRYEIARIDPLLVLPALQPGKTIGPFPTPSPAPSSVPSPGGPREVGAAPHRAQRS